MISFFIDLALFCIGVYCAVEPRNCHTPPLC